jgi:hypothetical protein
MLEGFLDLDNTGFLTFPGAQNPTLGGDRFYIPSPNPRFDFQTVPFISRRVLPAYNPYGAKNRLELIGKIAACGMTFGL